MTYENIKKTPSLHVEARAASGWFPSCQPQTPLQNLLDYVLTLKKNCCVGPSFRDRISLKKCIPQVCDSDVLTRLPGWPPCSPTHSRSHPPPHTHVAFHLSAVLFGSIVGAWGGSVEKPQKRVKPIEYSTHRSTWEAFSLRLAITAFPADRPSHSGSRIWLVAAMNR